MSIPGDTIAQILAGALQALKLVVVAVLTGRLITEGLARTYWAVIVWLTLDAIGGVLGQVLGRWDVFIFQVTQGLKLPFAAVILWQLCRLVFVNYPALASFATRALKTVIPACIVFGLFSFLTDPAPPSDRSQHLHLVIAMTRAATTAVLLFELLLGAFAGWFPVAMKRNIARLLIGLMVLYSVDWINMLLANGSTINMRWSNVVPLLASLTIVAYWLASLDRAGEGQSASALPAWNPARLAEMTDQLDEMQAHLSRRGFQ
jgi:hypothetical protein